MFRRLVHLPRCVFFDSAMQGDGLGRYSFVAADPFGAIVAGPGDDDPLGRIEHALKPFESPTKNDLPPFQGGAAGVLGYELGQTLERVPAARYDEFGLPALAVGLYDVVVAFDHQQGRAWVVSQGWPETRPDARSKRASARLEWLLGLLAAGDAPSESSDSPPASPPAIFASELAPQFDLPGRPGVTSDFSREAYLAAVARAVEYIHAGDVFQVNLTQRLLAPLRESPVDAYLKLRERNPAPFGGYCDIDGAQVLSASPERFLAVRDGEVETRPIKGTRRRSPDPAEDARLAGELLAHEKDRAENVMIVDLLRNDLSRVCEAASVRVPALCRLESYRHVHHLVSVVTGRLAEGLGPIDLLRASFPGGSITGAPKIRAMEIIAELEPTARGPYCGSLFYLGFNRVMDSSILIRTLVAARGWLQASVGGGIVADSDPAAEYDETLHKAAGLLP